MDDKDKLRKRIVKKLTQLQNQLKDKKNVTFGEIFNEIDFFVSDWMDIETEIERQEWMKRLNAKRT